MFSNFVKGWKSKTENISHLMDAVEENIKFLEKEDELHEDDPMKGKE